MSSRTANRVRGSLFCREHSLRLPFLQLTMKHTFFLILLFAVAVFGCGDGKKYLKTDAVEGTIQMDGQPLAEALVTFYPKDAANTNSGFARTDAAGKYKLQTMQGAPDAGTVPGDYIVTVSKAISVSTGKKVLGGDSGDELVDEMTAKELVADEFVTKAKTPFTATVESGKKNTFDFDVKAK